MILNSGDMIEVARLQKKVKLSAKQVRGKRLHVIAAFGEFPKLKLLRKCGVKMKSWLRNMLSAVESSQGKEDTLAVFKENLVVS